MDGRVHAVRANTRDPHGGQEPPHREERVGGWKEISKYNPPARPRAKRPGTLMLLLLLRRPKQAWPGPTILNKKTYIII